MILFVAVVVFLGFKRHKKKLIPSFSNERDLFLLKAGLYLAQLGCIICGFFHFFGPRWLDGYALVFFNLFGFYAVWTQDGPYLILSMALDIFASLMVTLFFGM